MTVFVTVAVDVFIAAVAEHPLFLAASAHGTESLANNLQLVACSIRFMEVGSANNQNAGASPSSSLVQGHWLASEVFRASAFTYSAS